MYFSCKVKILARMHKYSFNFILKRLLLLIWFIFAFPRLKHFINLQSCSYRELTYKQLEFVFMNFIFIIQLTESFNFYHPSRLKQKTFYDVLKQNETKNMHLKIIITKVSLDALSCKKASNTVSQVVISVSKN